MERSTDIRAYDDGRDRWEVRDAAPAGALRGVVERYTWWSEHTESFTTRRELASTRGVFIVNLGSRLEIVDACGELHRLNAGEGFAGGLARATSLSRSTGAMIGIHLHLPAPALARLLGLPLAELCDRVVSLDQLLGGDATALGGRLLAAAAHEERWAIMDAFVERRMARGRAQDGEVEHARRRLARGEPVSTIVDDLGWSRKRLAQRFRDYTGLLPRQYAGLARFERFTTALAANPHMSLAAAAVDAGYADQAHLTRKVNRFAALSPAALRARLVPGGGGVRE